MDIIFEILCGCLYVIGLCLGWDYKEASVNICIYWWPIICVLSTIPIIIGLCVRIYKNRHRWVSLYLLPISGLYTMAYCFIGDLMIEHYEEVPQSAENPIPDVFNACLHDFQAIAAQCGTTYAHANMIIYLELFFLIIFVNGVLTYFAFPHKNSFWKGILGRAKD
jgi:hypothetical protein